MHKQCRPLEIKLQSSWAWLAIFPALGPCMIAAAAAASAAAAQAAAQAARMSAQESRSSQVGKENGALDPERTYQ